MVGREKDPTICVEVSTDLLDVTRAVACVESHEQGAIDTFIGVVRNNHEGKKVTGITYDAHTVLAVKVFRDICREAQGFWPMTRYFVAHYQGEINVGGMSVVIAVSAPHRGDSFDSCRYVIDEIKKRAPIWKKEHYVDGVSDWLPGHSLVMEAESWPVCCALCEREGHAA